MTFSAHGRTARRTKERPAGRHRTRLSRTEGTWKVPVYRKAPYNETLIPVYRDECRGEGPSHGSGVRSSGGRCVCMYGSNVDGRTGREASSGTSGPEEGDQTLK